MNIPTKNNEELFKVYFPTVKIIAKKYLNWNEPFEDLVQIGAIGLIKAIRKLSARKNAQAKAYISATIAGEIRHYLRDKTSGVKISRKLIEMNAKVNKAIEAERVKSGKELSSKKVASLLKTTKAKILKAQDAVFTHHTVSMDQPLSSFKGGSSQVITLKDQLCYESEPEILIEKINVQDALEKLPKREQGILKMMYIDDAVQKDVAKAHKLTQAQVSRILKQSLTQLKEILA